MADAMTTTGTSGWDTTAYDQYAYYALRPELYFDMVADVQPTNQSHAGSAVTFTQTSDLAVASTALNESVDLDAVALADAGVTLTLVEYGNAVNTTAKLRATSYIDVMKTAANVVGFNAGVSIDTVARDILKAGTNVRYAGPGTATSRLTVSPGDTLAGNNVRRAVAELRGANVQTVKNGLYVGWIHPDVSYDFRGATGGANWRDPHTYSSPEGIWNGEVGAFEGVAFVETPRAPLFADSGSSTTLTDVYRTMIAGRQALAKAYSYVDGNGPYPKVVPGPVVDKLRRFLPVGWYWIGAYGIFRQAAIRGIESSSSIGTN